MIRSQYPIQAFRGVLLGDQLAALPTSASGATVYALGGALRVAQHAPPTITGSRGGNAALASLLTALANAGLIVNSTTL